MKGTAIKYGNNVDTDVIIPARYLNIQDRKELAEHCMEDIDQTFTKRVKQGDIMVAGKNFGCGSSREHAPQVIKDSGIDCIIAETFARIFYRNAINIGLPILECEKASKSIDEGDEITVKLETGEVVNHTKGEIYQAQSFPEFMNSIMKKNGLISATREKMEQEGMA